MTLLHTSIKISTNSMGKMKNRGEELLKKGADPFYSLTLLILDH